jgi:hypothetical protein
MDEETVPQQMRRIRWILGHVNRLGQAEKSYLKKRLNQVELKDA